MSIYLIKQGDNVVGVCDSEEQAKEALEYYQAKSIEKYTCTGEYTPMKPLEKEPKGTIDNGWRVMRPGEGFREEYAVKDAQKEPKNG